MEEISIGIIKGETCKRLYGDEVCEGIIDEHEKENGCSCHINPPCSSCVDDRNYWAKCGWSGREDQQNYITNEPPFEYQKIKTFTDLDKTKIDWICESHTSFSMKKLGVYPETATMKDVEEKVKGTFGGRFIKFSNGEFEYIAYTD